jgi:hypothetical protein
MFMAREKSAAVKFRTTLVGHDGMETAAVTITPKVQAALGGAGRIPVRGRINGGPEFRTTACRMGGPMFFVVNRQMREANGVKAGDSVSVSLAVDDQPRTIAVPRDLAAALSKAKLRKVFDQMSFTHRKEWVVAVMEARKPETRQRRIEKCVAAVGERARKAAVN